MLTKNQQREKTHASPKSRHGACFTLVHREAQERSGLWQVFDGAKWPEWARISYPEFSFGAVGRKEEEEGGRPTPPLSLLQAPLSIQWHRCRSGLCIPGGGEGVQEGRKTPFTLAPFQRIRKRSDPVSWRRKRSREGWRGWRRARGGVFIFSSEVSVCFCWCSLESEKLLPEAFLCESQLTRGRLQKESPTPVAQLPPAGRSKTRPPPPPPPPPKLHSSNSSAGEEPACCTHTHTSLMLRNGCTGGRCVSVSQGHANFVFPSLPQHSFWK